MLRTAIIALMTMLSLAVATTQAKTSTAESTSVARTNSDDKQNIPAVRIPNAHTPLTITRQLVKDAQPPSRAFVQARYSSDEGVILWDWHLEALLGFALLGQTAILSWVVFVTGRTANAAKKAAEVAERTLTEFESPFIFPALISSTLPEDLRRLKSSEPVVASVIPTVSFSFKNFGRTPALIQKLNAVLFFGDLEEAHTDHLAGHLTEFLLEPQGLLIEQVERKMADPVKKEIVELIETGGTRVFFRGRITFLDVIGNRYEQTFCFMWDKNSKIFVPWGPHRNRRKKINSKRARLA